MKYRVRLLTRAQQDVATCYSFIVARSPQGAASWFNRFCETRDRIADGADLCALAHETAQVDREIREVSFKTRRGRPYRVVFAIEGDEVLVLRVRGPGQDVLTAEDIE